MAQIFEFCGASDEVKVNVALNGLLGIQLRLEV